MANTTTSINILFGQLTAARANDEQKQTIQNALDSADWDSVFNNLKGEELTAENIAKEVLNSDDEEIVGILSDVLKECNEGEDTYKNKYDFKNISSSEKKYIAKNNGTLENGKYTYEVGDTTYTATQSKDEQISALRSSYSSIQKEEGIVSKVTGWIKNIFGAKSSPNYVESKLSALEEKLASGKSVSQSEIDEVNDLITNYSSRSEDGSNTAAAATGFGVGASCGAAIGSALFPGLGTVVGGILGGFIGGFAAGSTTKVVLEQVDNLTDSTQGNSFNLSDMIEDGVQGGLIGGVSGAAGSSMKSSGKISSTSKSASKFKTISNLLNSVVTFFTPEKSSSKTSKSEHSSAKSSLKSLAKSAFNSWLKSI